MNASFEAEKTGIDPKIPKTRWVTLPANWTSCTKSRTPSGAEIRYNPWPSRQSGNVIRNSARPGFKLAVKFQPSGNRADAIGQKVQRCIIRTTVWHAAEPFRRAFQPRKRRNARSGRTEQVNAGMLKSATRLLLSKKFSWQSGPRFLKRPSSLRQTQEMGEAGNLMDNSNAPSFKTR